MPITHDSHVHSLISCDSTTSIDAMCASAIVKGFERICFTEHFDMNPKDSGFQYFNPERYSLEIRQAREKYSGRLAVLRGIEFSEPHSYPAEFEKFQRMDFDFILCSVHWFADQWIAEKDILSRYGLEAIFEMYYGEVMKTVELGGFDALAHIDFPKRYLGRTHEPEDMIDEILGGIVRRNIALELNSSPLRKGSAEPYPSDGICRRYSAQGGRKVTVGSDAHSEDEIGKDFDRLWDVVTRHDFRIVSFVNRREEFCAPPACTPNTPLPP